MGANYINTVLEEYGMLMREIIANHPDVVRHVFVANAAFNNLGRPVYSTLSNWLRDGVLMYPACLLFGTWYAAEGVLYGQMAASIVAGLFAMAWGWRYVSGLEVSARTQTATSS